LFSLFFDFRLCFCTASISVHTAYTTSCRYRYGIVNPLKNATMTATPTLRSHRTQIFSSLTRVDDFPGRRTLCYTLTQFYQCQPPHGTARQTVNSRQPSLCGCGSAPHIWNTLPTDVVAASSLSTFRRLLKRFYSSNHILTSPTDIIQLVVLAAVAQLRPLE